MKYLNSQIVFYLPIILFSFFGCKHQKREIAGIINNQNIYWDQIDSIIFPTVNNARIEGLNNLMKKKILENEAVKNNMAIDSLIKKHVTDKIIIDKIELVDFINDNNSSSFYINCSVDTNLALKYLFEIKKMNLLKDYIDSLKIVYHAKTFYRPIYTNYRLFKKMYTHVRGN